MLNRTILIGRLTRDPELKYTPQGTAVCTFSLAVDRKFNKDETDFINCVAWRQSAEFIATYGGKGRLVAVEGRIQVRSYENKDGDKRKATEVVADDVRLLDKNDKAQSQRAAKGGDDGWEEFSKEVRLDDIEVPY